MAHWEYATLVMGTPGKDGRCWRKVLPDPNTPGPIVGKAEPGKFLSRLYQGVRLLDSAIEEMDKDGWELVSQSFDGLLFYFYGVAVFRRPKE